MRLPRNDFDYQSKLHSPEVTTQCLVRRTMDYPAKPSQFYPSNHRGAQSVASKSYDTVRLDKINVTRLK